MQNQDIRVELEDLTPVKKKLKVTVTAEAIKKEIKAAYQELKATAVVPGFRKGAVPPNILKARFGDHVKDDVTKKLIESSYPLALQEKGLIPVEAPNIDVKSQAEEGKEFDYQLTVEVSPKLEIEGYRGMELTRKKAEVTDKDVEEELGKIRKAGAKFNEVDRAAKEGDLVLVDFEGFFLDGEPIPKSKHSDYPVVIGEKTLLPGFDDALKGLSKGQSGVSKVTFPKNYSENNLAGKEGTFNVIIKAVKEKAVPELDAEFAKSIKFDTVEALKDKVREELIQVKEAQEKERVKNEILDKLIEKYQFEVPEALINRYLRVILGRVFENMRAGAFASEDKDLSPDDLKEKYRVIAVRQAKEDIVLDTIAGKEMLDVSPDEVDKTIRELAEARNVSFESLMSRIEHEGALEVIKDGMKHEKVFDIIIGASSTAA